MSNQGKILEWEEWVKARYVPAYAKRVLDEEPLPYDEAVLKYKTYKLWYRLNTAETAAADYAEQAAELQEEVERLRGVVEKTICTLLWQTDLKCKCSLCTQYRQASDRLEWILSKKDPK